MPSSTIVAPQYQANGLGTGLDDSTIIQELVQADSAPLTQLQTEQQNCQTQLSTLGTIFSDLQALQTATTDLQQNGVLAADTSGSNTTFSATPGTNAAAGNYTVQVTALAQAANFRSNAFAPDTLLAGGTLSLSVQGTTYPPITIADGTSLQDAANQIEASGAPVSAVVLSDGTNDYLSITPTQSGYPIGGSASSALSVSYTASGGSTNQTPTFTQIQGAKNATLTVDGLNVTSQSNAVTDAVPGTTINLLSTGAAENLVLTNDTSGTQARLQGFVTAYNNLETVIQGQLAPPQGTSPATTLQGDSTVQNLQQQLQALMTTTVGSDGNVRTLADLGIETQEDGTLSIDSTTLASAISRDPSAVNGIFSTATTGIGDLVNSLITTETDPADGLIILDQQGLNSEISSLTTQETQQQSAITAYQNTLESEFTAMETTVGALKNTQTYLTDQESASAAG